MGMQRKIPTAILLLQSYAIANCKESVRLQNFANINNSPAIVRKIHKPWLAD